MKYTVYEYNEKASSKYQGTRFMSGPFIEKQRKVLQINIIAENLSKADAFYLVDRTSNKNADAFLSSMPDELRDPKTDAFIKQMIKG